MQRIIRKVRLYDAGKHSKCYGRSLPTEVPKQARKCKATVVVNRNIRISSEPKSGECGMVQIEDLIRPEDMHAEGCKAEDEGLV